MKVLHVLGSLDQKSGGPLRAVLDISAFAAAHGLLSHIVGFGEVRIDDCPIDRENIHALPTEIPLRFGFSSAAKPWCQKNLSTYDGVVLHGMWQYGQLVFARECIRQGKPYACFPHGMLDLWPVFGQGTWKSIKKTLYWLCFERWTLESSQFVFFTTQREMDRAQRTFTLTNKRLILIPYGVSTSHHKSRLTPSRRVVQPAGLNIALFLGRIDPKKNIELLLNSWYLGDIPTNWHLVIAGTGPERYIHRLKLLMKKLGLENTVHFVGEVSGRDKTYLLETADWFLLPSKQENFGVAVLEAVNSGCAIAISNEVYLSDYFPDKAEILPLEAPVWATFLRDRMTDERWTVKRATEDRLHLLKTFAITKVAQAWASTLTAVFSEVSAAAFQSAKSSPISDPAKAANEAS